MLLSLADIAAMARRARDFNDLMLELSGAGGRIPRFLTKEQIEKIREAAGLSVSHETFAEKMVRHYLELVAQVRRQLYSVNRAIGKALKKSERRVLEAREALDDIRRRATVDDRGRKVFRTEDRQRGFAEDGQQLTREEFRSIRWDETAPTWEQYVKADQRLREAEEEREDILRAKERFDYYSGRMKSGDILSRDELDTIHQDLNAMPYAVRAEMPGRMAEAMEAPLSGEFVLSAAELADIKPEPQEIFAPHL
jgi:hypothetical protein